MANEIQNQNADLLKSKFTSIIIRPVENTSRIKIDKSKSNRRKVKLISLFHLLSFIVSAVHRARSGCHYWHPKRLTTTMALYECNGLLWI